MTLLVYLSVFAVFGACFALPQPKDTPLNEYFVFPNERKSGSRGLIQGRIVGGEEAKPHEYPYTVGFYSNSLSGRIFCGGALVSNSLILTAAHCVDTALSVDIILGAYIIDQDEPSQIKQSSNDFIIHSGWDRSVLVNDIAFIRLTEPVEENEYIKIIKIVNGEESYAGTDGILTGWGRTVNGQEGVTSVMRYVISDILSNQECVGIEPYASVITPTHLCISGLAHNEAVGTCNGDSGGPLAVDGILVGVVSFGYNDCEAGKPSVFTRLTEFRDWIQENSDIVV